MISLPYLSRHIERAQRCATSAVLVLALLSPCWSYAASPPRFLPDRDVKVQYTLSVPGRAPHVYDLAFSAQSERIRIDDPARKVWFIADLRNANAELVIPQLHAIVQAKDLANLTAILQAMHTAEFTRIGTAEIAGLACTRYAVRSASVSGTACLTTDGVALLVSGKDSHGSAHAVANQVTEAPVPDALLSPPSNFSTVSLPRGVLAALLGQ